jgi:ribonuclease HI
MMKPKKPSRTPVQYRTIASTCEYAKGLGYDVVVFTDGAFRKKGSLGGWAWAIVKVDYPENVSSKQGGCEDTTSQRMELSAIISIAEGFSNTVGKFNVLVLSDSSYCVKGINEWRHKWKREGWETYKWNAKTPTPVANQDLWIPLDELLFNADNKLTFEWVKGHDECEGNNLADKYANEAVESVKAAWSDPMAEAI